MKKKMVVVLLVFALIFSTFSITALACDNCLGDASYYSATGGITGTDVSLRVHHNTTEDPLGFLQPGNWINISRYYWNSNYEYPGWYYGRVTTNNEINGWYGWVCATYVRTYEE